MVRCCSASARAARRSHASCARRRRGWSAGPSRDSSSLLPLAACCVLRAACCVLLIAAARCLLLLAADRCCVPAPAPLPPPRRPGGGFEPSIHPHTIFYEDVSADVTYKSTVARPRTPHLQSPRRCRPERGPPGVRWTDLLSLASAGRQVHRVRAGRAHVRQAPPNPSASQLPSRT